MAQLSLPFLTLGEYMPHGMCYLWQPAMMALHATSDSVIGVSYVAVAVMIAWLGYRAREDLPFRAVFAAFGVFIVACGLTHLLEVYTLWQPIYWVSGGVKVVTAAASLATALALPEIVPEVLSTIRDARSTREQRTQLEHTVAELRESQSRFREMFEHAPTGMGLVALDGRWLQVNPALCGIVGYSAAELLGMDFQRITHPDDLLADLTQAERLAAGEIESYQVEKRYVRKDGRPVWVLLSGSAVRAADGSPLYFIAQVLDITARRMAGEQELELARAKAAREEAESAAERMAFLARVSSVLVSSLEQAPTLQAVAELSVPALGECCALDVLVEGTPQRVAMAQADAARPSSDAATSCLPT
ncbi:MAG TPA: PAS domain S-box protein, partial [Longimicrobiales bacterium]